MTKTCSVGLVQALVLMSLLANDASAQQSPPDKPTGFLDAIYSTLFGTSPKIPPSSEPTGAEPEQAAIVDVVAEVMDDEEIATADKQTLRRIEVMDDLDEAIKLSQLEQRPMLLMAGAEWCTWCRKLERELASQEAQPILTKWIVVKIDVDAQPALAEEFEISALPSLRVLSADRRVAAKREGYLPIAELQTWLDEAAPQVDPGLTRVLYEATVPDQETLAKLVEFLGHRSPTLRQSALRRLTASRTVSDKQVVEVLKVGKLAQKLCALDILRSWGAPVDGLDPWQPDTLSSTQIDALNSWLDSHPAPATSESEPAEAKPVDPAKLKDTVTRWLLQPESKSRLLTSELMAFGKSIVPEIRARLENGAEENDQQRTRLRELLMQTLAGEETRGLHAQLLTALASLQPDTHRQASARILEIATPADRALIDELVHDADPLVRELAVPALRRVGGLQQPDRLQGLLADKSPSVRTAVLREIAERAEPAAIEILTQHALQESDEDLLVYTAKTLGELLGHDGVDTTLCSLTYNKSWRVRAAALDALAYGTDRNNISGAEKTKLVVSTVIKAVDDNDSFVKQRALELLPELNWHGQEKAIVDFLVCHPEHIESFWEANVQYRRPEIASRLSPAALAIVASGDPTQIPNAITLIATIQPESLRGQLPTLVSSEQAPIRIAALKATVAYLNSIRHAQLMSLADKPESNSISSAREPWYTVPKSFLSNPDPPPFNLASRHAEPDELSLTAGSESTVAAEGNERIMLLTEVAALAVDMFDRFWNNADDQEMQVTEARELFGDVEIDLGMGQNNRLEPVDAGEARPLSAWLRDWYAQYDSRSGAEELESLRNQLRDAWDKGDYPEDLSTDSSSTEQVEIAWLAMANLALGRKELADRLSVPTFLLPQASRAGFGAWKLPIDIQILSWLPPEKVVRYVRELHLPVQEGFSSEIKALLDSITLYDNPEVATWLLDCVGSNELNDSQFSLTTDYLTRGLRGEHDRDTRMSIQASGLIGEEPFQEYSHKPVGYEAAMEWLYQQHQRMLSPTQKALLLVQLFIFDYRLGSQSAVGRVSEAKKWNHEVAVATAIALSAQSKIAADRAMQFLEHPLREVKLAAMKRLANSSNEAMEVAWAAGIGLTVDEELEVPAFTLTSRPMPVQILKPFAESNDPDEAWPAYLLLLACGEEKDVDWEEDELDSEQVVAVAAALAKAKRVDDEAIQFYRRAAERVHFYQQELLERILSTLENAEVEKIKASINASSATFVSPPF